ncbi:MAG TPA: hypothetical protein VHL77_00285 [Ferruginibacter sp.]|jgi:hypothetical protein|nr:hypothetical protein [Ferruginibacter sp.]
MNFSKLDIGELEAMIEKEIRNYEKAIRKDRSFEDARKIKWKIQLLQAELQSRNKNG